MRAMPADQPLAMARAPLHGRRLPAREQRPRAERWRLAAARLLLVTATLGLAAFGCHQMYLVVASVGPTPLQWLFLSLFGVNFLWISAAFCQAVLGFVRLRAQAQGGSTPAEAARPARTAVLIPVYNEDPGRVAAVVRAISPHLAAAAPGRFAVFVLSDTTDPDAWVQEEQVFRRLYRDAPRACPFYYRHRAGNIERKAGNIADWVRRWGGGYEAMLVLDADSLMAPETILTLCRRLAARPDLGLIQTLPSLIRGGTLFARLQQFAAACYGPVHAAGLAAWYGASGNYWGHNALIRVRAFAAACHLPRLPGAPPFGGHILSHDFAEAALLRRAGWAVEFHTDLAGSFEEAPPSLLESLARDRRWCQGNLQHARLLFARGLRLPSRLHLLNGIMSYVSAVVWLLLVAVGLALSLQASLLEPAYFRGPSLFPHWPVFEPERAVILLAVSMGVLLGPKALGWLWLMLDPGRREAAGGGGAATRSVVVETMISALYAPVTMLAHSLTVVQVLIGRDSGWKPQCRQGENLPWHVHWRRCWLQVAVGALTAGLSWSLNPHLFLWLLPFTTGLVLAPVLSAASGSRRLGEALRARDLLCTAEERQSPAIIEWFEACLARVRVPAPAPALAVLHADSELRQWHAAQLPAGDAAGGADAIDVEHVVARAKAARCGESVDKLCQWLSPGQARALLHDRDYLLTIGEAAKPTLLASSR